MLADAFPQHAALVISTLRLVQPLGKPTAMLGQGVGPLSDPSLCRLARIVLPRLRIITLREGRAGPGLLSSFGVPSERIIVTGDDAIEFAYENRRPDLTRGIGFNLRLAPYSDVIQGEADGISRVIRRVAEQEKVPLIGIPISRNATEDDAETLVRQLDISAHEAQALRRLDNPLDVIRQVGRCSVVVTGSYHAGVFAMAQGISVVGLAKSSYYADKFNGLAEQFGEGCTVLRLDADDLLERFQSTVSLALKRAEYCRAQLLQAAAKEIRLGREAYANVLRVPSIMEAA